MNDEPENLMVLTQIEDSIEDKLIILRASKFTMPMRQQLWSNGKCFGSV